MKLLVADDENNLAKALDIILTYNGYDVDIVYDGKSAFLKAIQNSYDALILDRMMPEMTGENVLKKLRDNKINTPVILLSAMSQLEDKVEGLDLGANDYITKPFETKELLARIRAVTRKEKAQNIFEFGNVIFNKESLKLATNKAALYLNKKESLIIETLISCDNRAVSKEEIKNRVWGGKTENEDTINMYISYLQEKFIALDANVSIKYNNGYSLEQRL